MKLLYEILFYYFERKRIRYFKKECSVEESRINLGGHSIYFLKRIGNPNYPALVLIHGFLDACYGFRKLIQHLDYPGSIYIPDLPGFGRSKLPEISYLYQMDVFADILYLWLEALNLEKISIAGHSMGGLIAQKMILMDQKKNSGRIGKCILLATGGIPHPKRDEMRRVLFPKTTKDISVLLGYLYHTDFPEPSWLAKKTLLYKWNGLPNQYLAENTIRREREIFFGSLAKEIKLPTLILVGDEDELTTVEMMKQYKKWIRGSKLEVLNNTRHALHNERPEQVARFMMDFL